jgi:protein-S-isoprenylcysteine O-methyltransferase Ste14
MTWDSKKIELYRESLRRHHDDAIEKEESMKRSAVGIISAVVVALSIICAYALPAVASSNSIIVYSALFASIIFSIASILFFIKVIADPYQPSVYFSLADPICSVENTINIGTADFCLCNATMLRYEVHEYDSQCSVNMMKRKLMSYGKAATVFGIVLMLTTMVSLYSQTSALSRFIPTTVATYLPVIISIIMVGITYVISVVVWRFASKNYRETIKRIENAESKNASVKSTLDKYSKNNETSDDS